MTLNMDFFFFIEVFITQVLSHLFGLFDQELDLDGFGALADHFANSIVGVQAGGTAAQCFQYRIFERIQGASSCIINHKVICCSGQCDRNRTCQPASDSLQASCHSIQHHASS
mmetsp:Transcript_68128/g.79272  ORF Transcript_68128/g.79272 Transcript_68128/m.79272 type:complete len:113 (-) Transcript_68128:949-1287(-)